MQDATELQIMRIFDAPVELAWKVWTEPEHVVNWWGPRGHTSNIHLMDFTEGGEWRLTIIGPDGTKYPNRSVYKEIVPFKKIVLEHFNPHFVADVRFESIDLKTSIVWKLLFDTAADYNMIVKTFRADVGQKENFEKLEIYLLHLQNKSPD